MIVLVRANTSSADTSQPDGGELEDCALIRLATLSAINQWHDVPCALNDVKQFICKQSVQNEIGDVHIIPLLVLQRCNLCSSYALTVYVYHFRSFFKICNMEG